MITDPIIKARVHEHHLFASLGHSELEHLLGNALRIQITPNESLFHQGDVAKRFYLVIRGHLQLYRTSLQGQDKVMDVVREGQTFAEALMFAQHASYPVSAQAVSKCVLVSFDRDTYLNLLKRNPDAGIAIMANMSVRLRRHLNEVELLSVQNAQSRLLLFMMSHLKHSGVNQGQIELDIPKRVLASRLSIQPETFSRLMKKMLTNGLIREHQGVIFIDDISRLYASANIPTDGETRK